MHLEGKGHGNEHIEDEGWNEAYLDCQRRYAIERRLTGTRVGTPFPREAQTRLRPRITSDSCLYKDTTRASGVGRFADLGTGRDDELGCSSSQSSRVPAFDLDVAAEWTSPD